ncbi:MAG: LamG-like jellyroll fold domain-containing protein [Sedimentisphaeraceae bacterium JB056]
MLKNFVLLLVVFGLVSFSQANMVSHYQFDGDWSNSVSGGYSVSPVGGANIATDAERGQVGGFQYFDGVEEFGHIGYDPAFAAVTTQITVAAWVKSNSNNYSVARIAGRGYSWYMYVNGNDTLGFNAGGGVVTGNSSINDGDWHHVAATFDTVTGSMALYVDGELDAQDIVSGTIPNADRYAIAARATSSTAGASFYHGYIDDVRIYNDVQSLSQIQDFSGVPEPATMLLLGVGAIALRRRKMS